MKPIVAVLVTVFGFFIGEATSLFMLLFIACCVDVLTGWWAAIVTRSLKSRVGYYGIMRKMAMFLIVMFGNFVDIAMGDSHFVRDGVIIFYILNETISIVENTAKLGLPFPPVILEALETFNRNAKGRPKEGEKDNAEPPEK